MLARVPGLSMRCCKERCVLEVRNLGLEHVLILKGGTYSFTRLCNCAGICFEQSGKKSFTWLPLGFVNLTTSFK